MTALARIRILRAAPLTTIQDAGRFGRLGSGIAASGPMDVFGWQSAGGGASGIEFTRAGLEFELMRGPLTVHVGGGRFHLRVNGDRLGWPARVGLVAGDRVGITPGRVGLYGYVRFSGEIDVPHVLGSRSTNTIAGLGGLEGRTLRAGDQLDILAGDTVAAPQPQPDSATDAPFRFLWGLHADLFGEAERRDFVSKTFHVSQRLDRMGVRLEDREGVFSAAQHLSLVSESVVPGDVQILGDGTPIILMRDHQPTGGYPRIATLLTPEINRFAQMRPGAALRFVPVSLKNAST
ncbi:MAG: biotin-dependent carboxyltransferase family protein [Alphaproteobacteria bacterium]|nr:biotin-dependent carboxyltransferase family protein [Alphaproteobacteria bacterium]